MCDEKNWKKKSYYLKNMTNKKSNKHKKHSKKCCPSVIIITDKSQHDSSSSSSSCHKPCNKIVTSHFSNKCCKSKNIEVVERAVASFAAGDIKQFLSLLEPNATLVFNGANPPIPFGGTYQNLFPAPGQTTPTVPQFFVNQASAATVDKVVTQSIQFNCGFSKVTAFLTIQGNVFCPNKPEIKIPFSSTFVIEHIMSDQCKIQTLNIFTDSSSLAVFYKGCNDVPSEP